MDAGARTVVLGAGYAGVLATLRLARRGLDVTLVNRSEDFCERIRLHQRGGGQNLTVRSIASLLGESSTRFVRADVERIDLAGRRVLSDDGTSIAFDQLVVATGSRSDRDTVVGARKHSVGIGDPTDAESLSGEIAALAESGARILVVGGGLTGIETATELAESHPTLAITLASSHDPAAAFSRRARRHLNRRLSEWGIRLASGVRVEALEASEARLANGERIGFDRCIWAGSFRPGPLAEQAGLEVDAIGRVVLDAQLRSRSHPFVSAVGDAGRVLKSPARASAMSCQLAMPMGAYVADRLAAEAKGRSAPPFRFRALLRCVSLGRSDALVQLLRSDESAAPFALTGRRAAWIKEFICRTTVHSFDRERNGAGYRWLGGAVANEANVASDGTEEVTDGTLARAIRS